MKIAFIADIHGNSVALNKCLLFLKEQTVSNIYFLGDAVGYLPFAKEVIGVLQKEEITCIKGNHEAMLLGELPVSEGNEEVYRLGQAKKSLSTEELSFIASWSNTYETIVDKKKLLMMHGSPKDYLCGYIYPDTDLEQFAKVPADVIVFSHTHYPFTKTQNGKLFINAGSVGLPRDCGNLSSVAIYDSVTETAAIYRIPFITDVFLAIEMTDKIHPAVVECLLRKKETCTGNLIN